MDKQPPDDWARTLPSISRLAYKMAKGSGHSHSELFSVGLGAYPKATRTWDTDRSSFSTWWSRLARNAMVDYVRRTDLPLTEKALMRAIEPYMEEGSDDPLACLRDNSPSPDRIVASRDTLRNLSEEAQLVASIVLAGPTEFLGIAGTATPKAVRGAIVRWLRDNTNWSWSVIWDTFRELKEAYS